MRRFPTITPQAVLEFGPLMDFQHSDWAKFLQLDIQPHRDDGL